MEYFPNNANGLISGSFQNWTVLMFPEGKTLQIGLLANVAVDAFRTPFRGKK
jgi:hypothetical protein